MKTTIQIAFFIFTLLPFYSIHAQLDIIEWVYEVDYNDQGVFTNVDTNRISIEIEKDTLINGITVQKLTVPIYVDVHENYTGTEYVYEESRLVFIWNDGTESFDTLYNYNLDTGDRWMLGSETIVTVDSVKMVTISGEEKKQFHVTYENNTFGSINRSHNSIITEGFGDHIFYFNYVRFESAPIGASYFDPSLILVKTEDGIIENINDTSEVFEVTIDDCTPDIDLNVKRFICEETQYISLASTDDFENGSLLAIYGGKRFDTIVYNSDNLLGYSYFTHNVSSLVEGDSLELYYVFEDKCGEEYIHKHVVNSVPCSEVECSLGEEELIVFEDISNNTICSNYNRVHLFNQAEHFWERTNSPFVSAITGDSVVRDLTAEGHIYGLSYTNLNKGDLLNIEVNYRDYCGELEVQEHQFVIGDSNCALEGMTTENIGLDSIFNEKICVNSDPILIELNSNNIQANSISGDGIEFISGDYYFNPSLLEFGDSSVISVNLTNGSLTKTVYISCVIDGLTENNKTSKPTIYPNPSKGSFKIDSEYNINYVVVYSSIGGIVLEQSYQAGELITDLEPGIYIMELRDENSSFKNQLIVE